MIRTVLYFALVAVVTGTVIALSLGGVLWVASTDWDYGVKDALTFVSIFGGFFALFFLFADLDEQIESL